MMIIGHQNRSNYKIFQNLLRCIGARAMEADAPPVEAHGRASPAEGGKAGLERTARREEASEASDEAARPNPHQKKIGILPKQDSYLYLYGLVAIRNEFRRCFRRKIYIRLTGNCCPRAGLSNGDTPATTLSAGRKNSCASRRAGKGVRQG